VFCSERFEAPINTRLAIAHPLIAYLRVGELLNGLGNGAMPGLVASLSRPEPKGSDSIEINCLVSRGDTADRFQSSLTLLIPYAPTTDP